MTKFSESSCPWCKSELGHQNRAGFYFGCINKKCEEQPSVQDAVGVGDEELGDMWLVNVMRPFAAYCKG